MRHLLCCWPFVSGIHRSVMGSRPITRTFRVSIDDSLHKLLDKNSRGWWFETPRRSCDASLMHSYRSYIYDLINLYGCKYLRTISHWKYAINPTIYISSLQTYMSILTILWLSTYFIANRIVDILRWFRSQIFQCLRRLPSAHIGFYCIYLISWYSQFLNHNYLDIYVLLFCDKIVTPASFHFQQTGFCGARTFKMQRPLSSTSNSARRAYLHQAKPAGRVWSFPEYSLYTSGPFY